MDKALQSMIDNMPEKTGKSLGEWTKILQAKAFEKHGEAVKYLKTEHGVTHGFANTIVTLAKREDQSPTDLVEQQYAGKENLYPLYQELLNTVKSLGDDVRIEPKKTSVSIIRKRQFLLIKPATKSRIDLGFKLPGKPTGERLQDSGPFGSMCTHRVQLQELAEIDLELKAWIQEAYEASN